MAAQNLTLQICEDSAIYRPESAVFIKRLPLMAGISKPQKPIRLHRTIPGQIGESRALLKSEIPALPIWNRTHTRACRWASGDS
jgi:hypothetical protein